MDDSGGPVVLGRQWELGAMVRRTGQATVHVATSQADPTGSYLAQVHDLPSTVDSAGVTADVVRAAGVESPALLRVLDVGIVPDGADGADRADGGTRLYVVSEWWDEELQRELHQERELRLLAGVAADGLGALHRGRQLHGGLYTGSFRRVAGSWKLASGGLAPVLRTEIAPYRPPGLHVTEPPSAAADMWNLGIVLHELSTGRLLGPGEVPTVPDIAVVDDLVGWLLQRDPEARPTAEQVAELLAETPFGERPTLRDEPGHVQTDHSQPGGAAASGAPTRTGLPPGEIVEFESERSSVDRSSFEPDRSSIEPDPTSGGQVTGTDSSRHSRLLAASAVLVVIAGVVVAAIIGFGLLGDSQDPEVVSSPTASSTDDQLSPGTDGGDAPNPASEEEVTDSATDEISREGEVALAALQVGDCVDVALGQGLFDTAELRSCDAEHRAEVIALASPPGAGPDADYPGRAALLAFGQELCGQEFAPYVGSSIFDTVLAQQPIVPTFGDWRQADRQSVICLVSRFDASPLDRTVAEGSQHFKIIEGATTSVGKLIPGKCFNLVGDELDSTGKRQDVTVVGCLSRHGFEVFDFVGLPIEEADEDGLNLAPDRFTEFAQLSLERCTERWAELAPTAGAGSPVVRRILPDEYDWQTGDRFYLCVVAWPEPVATSAVLNANLAASGDNG